MKIKAKEFCFNKLMEKKETHSKMKDLFYSEIKIQDYLKGNQFTTTQAKLIYSFRTRMANFRENFKGGEEQTTCPLCQTHLDSQVMALKCPKLTTEVKINGKYEDLFREDISMKLVKTLTDIMTYSNKYDQEHGLEFRVGTQPS